MDLYPHNRKAYEKLVAMLEDKDRVCIVQPTGTGKFVIGAHFAMEHPDSRILWLCPHDYIFMEQNDSLRRIDPQASIGNVTQMTYASAMVGARRGTLEVEADYIVLDEFHHIGAPEWGKGVAEIVRQCPNAKFIGMSATERRWSDGDRNVAMEFFEGNVASSMSLEEAFLLGILPFPVYVTAMYESETELGRIRAKVGSVKDARRRGAIMQKYEMLRRSITEADNLDVIFEKHIGKRDSKLIVFCRDVMHLKAVEALRLEWFGRVNANINSYKTYSDNPAGEMDYRAFKEDESSALKILYCVDQLNEGVHIDGIDGVVMVRPTSSPVVFRQQLGRALDVGGSKTPLVFDLVNNLGSAGDYLSLGSAMEVKYDQLRRRGERPPYTPKDFVVHDEVKGPRELMEAIREELSTPISIDEMIEIVLSYRDKTPSECDEHKFAADVKGVNKQNKAWECAKNIRRAHRDGRLSAEQIARLEGSGFDFRIKLRNRAVVCYETGEVFENVASAALRAGCRKETLQAAIIGRWASGGFHWLYADEPKPDLSEFRKSKKKLTEEQKTLIIEAVISGERTCSQIGAEFNVSESCVRRIAKERGIAPLRTTTAAERAEILELLKQGRTNVEITSITGRSATVIGKVSRENDIRRRRHLVSQDDVRKCRELLEEGHLTYAEIAEMLNVPKDAVHGFAERYRLGKGRQKAKPVLRVETGDVYASAKEAAESVGSTAQSIRASIHTGHSCRGFHWRYVIAEEAASAD